MTKCRAERGLVPSPVAGRHLGPAPLPVEQKSPGDEQGKSREGS